MSPLILVVEDEAAIQAVLKFNLEKAGFRVSSAKTGEEAFHLVAMDRPDLVLLDWMLPGISGVEICRLLRQKNETKQIPIILLTARSDEADKIRGLNVGADDYVVKPFSVQELIARCFSLLRRSSPETVQEIVTVGDITLDLRTYRVTRGERDINLSPREFRLLELLMRNPGRVYNRAQLLDIVWGQDAEIDERTVDVHVGRLRKSLCRNGEIDPVRTVREVGYAFNERFGKIWIASKILRILGTQAVMRHP